MRRPAGLRHFCDGFRSPLVALLLRHHRLAEGPERSPALSVYRGEELWKLPPWKLPLIVLVGTSECMRDVFGLNLLGAGHSYGTPSAIDCVFYLRAYVPET